MDSILQAAAGKHGVLKMSPKLLMDNEDASAQGYLSFILLVVACGFIWLGVGYVYDLFVFLANQGAPMYLSQDSLNTLVNIGFFVRAIPTGWFLLIGFNFINNANRSSSGEA